MDRVGRDEEADQEGNHEDSGSNVASGGLSDDGEEGKLRGEGSIDVLNGVDESEGHGKAGDETTCKKKSAR